jgi:hypothetical protein
MLRLVFVTGVVPIVDDTPCDRDFNNRDNVRINAISRCLGLTTVAVEKK